MLSTFPNPSSSLPGSPIAMKPVSTKPPLPPTTKASGSGNARLSCSLPPWAMRSQTLTGCGWSSVKPVNTKKTQRSTTPKRAGSTDWQADWRLHRAVVEGVAETVRAELNQGADPNSAALGGLTPLHKAAFRGDVSVCQALLSKQASVHLTNSAGQTPLHLAASKLQPGVVQLLLCNQAPAESVDRENVTAARLAVAQCHSANVDLWRLRLCLDHLVRSYDRHWEANHRRLDVLTEGDVPPGFQNASQLLHPKSRFPALGDGPVSPSGSKSGSACASPRFACDAATIDGSSLSQLALNRSGLPSKGNTSSLELSVPWGQRDTERLRVCQSSSPRCLTPTSFHTRRRGEDGEWRSNASCLHAAIVAGDQQACVSALKSGVDVDDGAAPALWKAAENGHLDLVRVLLEHNASPNSASIDGESALHAAAAAAQPAIVDLLLRNRADVAQTDARRVTPLRCAINHLNMTEDGPDVQRLALVLDLLLKAQEKDLQRLHVDVAIREPFDVLGEDTSKATPGKQC